MPQRSQAQLVRACTRGEPEAWDELLERYGRLIWAVALRLGARQEEAEEIFQRAWVAIVESIHDLREPRLLASWVAGTTRFQTYRLFSEQGRQRRLASLEEAGSDVCDPQPTVDTEGELLRIEEVAALRDALDRLDERCRILLQLLFFHQPALDYQTISQRTGLAVGSIGPIRARCLKRLRRVFDNLYQTTENPDT
jgi:RNA polymerase sigma factor (sigma-70 family)